MKQMKSTERTGTATQLGTSHNTYYDKQWPREQVNNNNNNNKKLIQAQNFMIDATREIQELEQGKTYKYLRIEKKDGIQHQQMREKLQQVYKRRLRMILKSELNAKNKNTGTEPM